ncbi:DUF357 domain-containing protein [archaeon]|jgi:uncharacterized protein|nr:DUF357 domain-containing protein [archaeon]
MENEITIDKVEKYFNLTECALKLVKENIIDGREADAAEIIDMVTNYVSDAHHFFDKEDLINAFAALNYAHGWLDSGVRLHVFDVDDDRLFTVC